MATNINEFLKQFKANQQLALDASAKVINATLLDMYKKIIDRTPIGNPALWNKPYWPAGYTPGQLKESWQLSFNGVQRGTNGKFASTGQTLSNYGLSLSVNSANGQKATISNPQPYAQRVETGWSSQAPQGMMRVTVAEYTSLINNNAAKYRIR